MYSQLYRFSIFLFLLSVGILAPLHSAKAAFTSFECGDIKDYNNNGTPFQGWGYQCFVSQAGVLTGPVELSTAETIPSSGYFMRVSNFSFERSEIIVGLTSEATNITSSGATISRTISSQILVFSAAIGDSVDALILFDTPEGEHSFRISKPAGSDTIAGFKVYKKTIPDVLLNEGTANKTVGESVGDFKMNVRFTEDVVGLAIADFNISNGAITNIEIDTLEHQTFK